MQNVVFIMQIQYKFKEYMYKLRISFIKKNEITKILFVIYK